MKRPIAYFAGTGRGIPATVMTNFDFAAIGIETTDEWIVERTGIKQRHIAKTESATDLAARPRRARRWNGPACTAGELDIIVLGTASPDRLLPSAAVDLQAALGASRAAAFDVGAACSGFIYSADRRRSDDRRGQRRHRARRRRREAERDHRLDRPLHLRPVRRRRGRRRPQALASSIKGILSTFMRSDGTLGDLLCRPVRRRGATRSRRRCSPTARSSSR